MELGKVLMQWDKVYVCILQGNLIDSLIDSTHYSIKASPALAYTTCKNIHLGNCLFLCVSVEKGDRISE